ncbi:nuclear transport factor 2 family protein [Trujillonella humicola]|uniref:nuclear transport factor 2 family protein n=1 Tax=Trujillonella humicola TaxID=3383699 RepID=UPI0039061556
MARTPQEIFQHHASALMAGDIDEIVADYADDALFITPAGVLRGKDGVREGFTRLLGDLPDAAWDVPTQVYEDDVLFIEWSAASEKARGHGRHRHVRVPRRLHPGADGALHPGAHRLRWSAGAQVLCAPALHLSRGRRATGCGG